MRLTALGFAAAALAFSTASATEFRPLSPREGAAILSARDEYMRELSPVDLSLRLRRPEGGNVEEFRTLYASAARAWTDEERERLNAMAARHGARISLIAGWLPEEVGFIKTTADVEGGLPHTRDAAVVFGPALPRDDRELDYLFFHELFHVLSRRNAARRDELYALIGFVPCTRVALPAALERGRITNPDAPVDRHVVPIVAGDRYLLPRLMSNSPRFDPARPAFPGYFTLRFVLIERSPRGRCRAVRRSGTAVLVDRDTASSILRLRAGANTSYFFHPEEILADNFAQLMLHVADVPDPSVHERLSQWLGLPPSNQPDRAPPGAHSGGAREGAGIEGPRPQ